MAKRKMSILEATFNLSRFAELAVPINSKEEVEQTFQILNEYLLHLYHKERAELENPLTRKGIAALIQLADEAIVKIKEHSSLFHQDLVKYQQFHKFFKTKEIPKEVIDERQTFKDLDIVRRDEAYELLYIRKKDGSSFFSPNVLRHIRLISDFDESLLASDEDNPLKRMEVVLDRDAHLSAKEILEENAVEIEAFCKKEMKHKTDIATASLSKALMGLLFAANPKNLLHNTEGKHCIDYFTDFQYYLRQSFSAPSVKPLAYALCGSLFLRSGSHADVLHLIKALGQNPEETLHKFPNGPLLLAQIEKESFDPLLQNNTPHKLFSIASETLHLTFLHLPCPTRQSTVDEADIAQEFTGFLRFLKGKTHLLIVLQEPSSRTKALEKCARSMKNLILFSLPHTSYPEDVSKLCKELKNPKLSTFVHTHFFNNKKSLTSLERHHFVAIFHFFLILQTLEEIEADTASFTCKDGVDQGAPAAALFYAFARLLSSSSPWSSEDENCFLFTLYRPALLVRHRLPHDLSYTLSVLAHFKSVLSKDRTKILKACADLFPIQTLKISDVA